MAGAMGPTAGGTRVLDLAGGGFGDAHPRVLQRVEEQLGRMALSSQLLPSQPFAELLERLAHLAPEPLSKSVVQSSGAEAADVAIRLALAHRPGRRRVVATRRSYHGSTVACRALHDPGARRLVDLETVQVDFGDAGAIAAAVDESTAAVVLEPFATAHGLALPPAGYLAEVAALCRQAGALLVCDEVVTGLGRTGAMLGLSHHGAVPDVVVLGDALGGGLAPVGACLASPAVFARARRGAEPLLYGTTTSGNPLACAAAAETLAVIQDEDLCGRAATLGRVVSDTLESWARRHPRVVLDTAWIGLLASIRLASREDGIRTRDLARRSGCLVRLDEGGPEASTWLSLRPPLAVTEDELRAGLAALDGALALAERDREAT